MKFDKAIAKIKRCSFLLYMVHGASYPLVLPGLIDYSQLLIDLNHTGIRPTMMVMFSYRIYVFVNFCMIGINAWLYVRSFSISTVLSSFGNWGRNVDSPLGSIQCKHVESPPPKKFRTQP